MKKEKETNKDSSVLLLFYYLAPQQSDSIVTSVFMQFTFGDKGDVYPLDESVLPVTEKEKRQEGKRCIGPRMNSPLSPKVNCMHHDVRMESLCCNRKA